MEPIDNVCRGDLYDHPLINVLDIQTEGLLCQSNEILDEIDGEW